ESGNNIQDRNRDPSGAAKPNGRNGVPHANEVWNGIGLTGRARCTVLAPVLIGQCDTLVLKLVLLRLIIGIPYFLHNPIAVPVDTLHSLTSDFSNRLRIAQERLAVTRCGNPTQSQNAAKTSDGIGAAAESEQEDAIS